MDRKHPIWMGPTALAAATLAALTGCSDAPTSPSARISQANSIKAPGRFHLPADVRPVALEITEGDTEQTIENPFLQSKLPTPFASSVIGLPPLPEASPEPAAPAPTPEAPRYMPLIEAQPQSEAPVAVPAPRLDEPDASFSLEGPQISAPSAATPNMGPSKLEGSRWSNSPLPPAAPIAKPEPTPEAIPAPQTPEYSLDQMELFPLEPGTPNEPEHRHEMRSLPAMPPAPELSAQPPAFMPRIEAEPAPQPVRQLPPAAVAAPLVQGPPAQLAPLTIPPQAFNAPPQSPTDKRLDLHAMTAVRGRAQSLIEHSFSLAQRGAFFSARAELIQALRLLTQTLDTERQTHEYSEALAEGLLALEEASDFVPEGSRLEANVNLERLIQSHRTPILKNVDASQLTPLVAAQQYFSHAQDRLATACGGVPEASAALYGLAKLQPYLKSGSGGDKALIGPRSIALHQSAFLADPQNILAANELGVFLARYGQLNDAKAVFVKGLRAHSLADTWNNLAKVHELLGEQEMANLAREEAKYAAAQGGVAPKGNFVRWVSPEAFANQQRRDETMLGPQRPDVSRQPQTYQQR
ncbi:hypothetical protein LOC68_05995 [Blastopirellula sp. JC732]|uniref:Tetratricopeptide repeat protein n=1 Tax=Blastopirellula sediminis TaxID=2894196 RepID=A0A9X1SEK2_9BACT|nr:hypothetical protein [Blastopirellula sediminis]MCC9609283.1 hypothetical protein [Blastopirellula sediminis]MCC9627940.1 hypothetical protein [Blastopirellula sediminis]